MSSSRPSWDVDPRQSHPSDLHDSSPVAADSGSCAPAKPAESSGIGEEEIEQERKDREEAGMEFVDLLLDLKVKRSVGMQSMLVHRGLLKTSLSAPTHRQGTSRDTWIPALAWEETWQGPTR